MPFVSRAQQRWAFGTGQDFAERWARETNFSKLPPKKAESYTPPASVRDAAQRALDARAEASPSNRGMTAVGLARARQLVNGQPLSETTIRRMKAYFDRHEVDKQGSTWDEKGKGWQAWNGWGGDAARSWVEGIISKLDSEQSATKAGSRHSASDMKMIREIRNHAKRIAQLLIQLGDDSEDDDEEETDQPEMKSAPEYKADDLAEAYAQITMQAMEEGLDVLGLLPCGDHIMIATQFGIFKVRCVMTENGIACEATDQWRPMGDMHEMDEEEDEGEYAAYRSATEVKALDEEGWRIGGYAFLFGDDSTPDLSSARDYATKNTNFWLDQWTTRPMIYEHGLRSDVPTPLRDNPIVGTWTKATIDEIGVFVEGEIRKADEYASAIRELVKRGKLRLSSDSLAHLVKREAKGNGVHWLKEWPMAAVSLTATPADPAQIDRPLRPVKANAVQDDTSSKTKDADGLRLELDLIEIGG